MKKLLSVLTLTLLVAVVCAQQPRLTDKLPIDKEVRIGKLKNGMTYYIRHYENPKNRAEFFIVHNVGAVQEEDNQNGLAHFLEHMAFNGTKNFPDKTMFPYLESLGVKFGYNINAYTSKDRTVYNISQVPIVREQVIDSVLLLLHDWSYYISCEPQAIEDERGVIREEWRRSDDARTRMMRHGFMFETTGSKFAKRNVIGDFNIINNFERQTLLDFYHKWYRTDLQAIVVVGDVDLDLVEQKIIAICSSIPAQENPEPKENYEIPNNKEPLFTTFSDPETKAIAVKFTFKQDYPTDKQRSTVWTAQNDLLRDIFTEMASIRFNYLKVNNLTPLYKNAIPVQGPILNKKQAFRVTVTPTDDAKFLDAIKGAYTELQRIKRYGFTQDEFDQALASIKKKTISMEKMLDTKFTNDKVVEVYIDHFTHQDPLTFPTEIAKIKLQLIGKITPKQVAAIIPEMIPEHNQMILFMTPQSNEKNVPSNEVVLRTLKEIEASKIEPLNIKAAEKLVLFNQKLTPGKVVKEVKNADLDAVEWTLSNGVKVIWKTTSDKKASVLMSASSNGGYAYVSDAQLPAALVLDDFKVRAGVAGFDNEVLSRFLSEKDASAKIGMTSNHENLSGSAAIENFEILLQLNYLNLVCPRFDQAAFDKFIKRNLESLGKPRSDENLFGDELYKLGHIPSRYTHPMTIEDWKKLKLEDFKDVFAQRFGNAADFTYVFVGAIPEKEAKPLIEKYIGSLPATKSAPETCKFGGSQRANGNIQLRYVIKSQSTPKANVAVTFHGKLAYTSENLMALKLIKHVLSDRYMVSIREEKGGTYYVGVAEELIKLPYEYATILINFDTDQKLVDILVDAVNEEVEDILKNGVKAEELQPIITYLQRKDADKKIDNNLCLRQLTNTYFDGFDIKANEMDVLSKLTPEKITEVAREFFGQGNKILSVLEQR